MSQSTSEEHFRENIINQIDAILRSCEESRRPLEVDPARGELFELFALADRSGALVEDSPNDLTAGVLCKALAERWGLKTATENWLHQNTSLGAEQLARMRSLWSLLRLWMEWTYAWQRWEEFHSGQTSPSTNT